jgi:mono/diheme cytochrome c family protein
MKIRIFACAGLLLAGLTACAAAEKVSYNRDVRPIISENCFTCHGPDRAARKADLRLDQRKAAVEAGAIEPGEPDESEMIVRIYAKSAKKRMPPASLHKTLSDQQKELLKRWIAEGAEYQPHWSFIAPTRPQFPVVKDAAWASSAIDAFVLEKLEERGLSPAPEADRRTLARRASLDLTGLPPKPEDVETFVNDSSPNAYEAYVDRQLASPRWGEHRARYWLDAARYADTHGIHFDNYREIWAYRDWVIDAFNNNVPFDRFTREQLAGDLLPDPTLDQQIATGFNRCNITTNEGGAIDEEYLVLYARDRTEASSRVWLGLTANCAVCHDHKYDPLAQREFYALSALFNNTTQGAMDGNVKDTPPVVFVPRRDDRPRWDALAAEIAQTKKDLDARKAAARGDFDRWLESAPSESLSAMDPRDGLHFAAPLSEGDGGTVRYSLAGAAGEANLGQGVTWDVGHVAAKAFRPPPGGTLEVADAGDFDNNQPFSFGAWVKISKPDASGAVLARMDDQNAYRGWDLWLEGGRFGSHIINRWQDDALKVVSTRQLAPGQWQHVFVTYDGANKAEGLKLYLNGEPQNAINVAANSLKSTIRTKVPLKIAQRNASARIDDLLIQDARIYDRLLSSDEVRKIARSTRSLYLAKEPAAERSDADKAELFDGWLAEFDEPYKTLTTRTIALDAERATLKSRSTVAHVMQERGEPAKAFVLFRGDYDKRREEVTPDTPAFLPPMPPDAPHNRLGFANWLLRSEQPLTARVTVNRFWQELFGAGLVRTSDDFGVSGEPPSHPELLDWLAVEFRESGWDVKKLFKLLVMSAAYRQAAVVTPEKLEKDPSNRLVSRGPRFRMDAEMVRDCALAAGGLLAPKIGGPSVKPYQPDGVWEAVAMIGSDTRDYRRDAGEALYRRSLYTFWKRAAPPPSMEIFNAPSREVCTVRRERTNTPLQSLVTLNDPQFVEAARNLAQLALKNGGETAESRLDFLARRVLSRPLRAEELGAMTKSVADFLEYYQAYKENAQSLVAVGESKADPALDVATLAAWTIVANQLLNLDEALNK